MKLREVTIRALWAFALYVLVASRWGGGSSAAATKPIDPNDHSAAAAKEGQRDFDFEIGTWKSHSRKRLNPLTGSNTWIEFDGIAVVRKLWNGRANLVELNASGPAGPVHGLSMRLYNPASRQWSLYYANASGGAVSVPTVGRFINGRGEFYDQELYNGKAIWVRNVWSAITPNSCHFEQAFSEDGGRTWEVNLITTDQRSSDANQNAQ